MTLGLVKSKWVYFPNSGLVFSILSFRNLSGLTTRESYVVAWNFIHYSTSVCKFVK